MALTINKSSEKLHKDMFPLELPEKCIKLCGYDVKTVLDPYSGSGTTGLACKRLGKDFIGIEQNKEYVELSEDRINSFITRV